jgi:hypothetical protein
VWGCIECVGTAGEFPAKIFFLKFLKFEIQVDFSWIFFVVLSLSAAAATLSSSLFVKKERK